MLQYQVVSILQQKKTPALPGLNAQLNFAPELRDSMMQDASITYRDSAVLILIFPDQLGKANIVFIERNVYDGVHSGQIGYPGGKLEKGESYLEAALRETKEELDIDVAAKQVALALTPLKIPVSRFIIHPFVAVLNEKPIFKPDVREVQQVFTVTLEDLWAQKKRLGKFRGSSNFKINAPYLLVENKRLWGASAMILAELKALLTNS